MFEQLNSRGGMGLCMPIEVFEQLNSRGGICMGLCTPIELLVVSFQGVVTPVDTVVRARTGVTLCDQ